jgi:hypothetical protein
VLFGSSEGVGEVLAFGGYVDSFSVGSSYTGCLEQLNDLGTVCVAGGLIGATRAASYIVLAAGLLRREDMSKVML